VDASPFGESARDEGCRGRRIDDGRGSQALLCDRRILMLSEEILQRLGLGEEPHCGLA